MIDKLTYFLAVAQARSFRRASEACGVGQPTLSAGIKQLEDELGVMLIRRSSRFHGLTPEGEKVLEWAKRLVGDARSMRQELAGMRVGPSGRLRIAVIPTALAMAPVLTVPCRKRHPALRFTILSGTSSESWACSTTRRRTRGSPAWTTRRWAGCGPCRSTPSATASSPRRGRRPAGATRSPGRRWARCRCAG